MLLLCAVLWLLWIQNRTKKQRVKLKILKIGIDFGGTKIEGIGLDARNNIIERKRIPTEQGFGYDHVMKNLIGLYHDLLGGNQQQLHRFVIGIPGNSNKEGLLKKSSYFCLNLLSKYRSLQKN